MVKPANLTNDELEAQPMIEALFTHRAKVERVVDGDTVDLLVDLGFDILLRERVRLAGIDAPESRTRDLDEKARGLAATAFVEQWVTTQHREVILRSTDFSTGKYGRCLGRIFDSTGSECLNDRLIEEGHAVIYGEDR